MVQAVLGELALKGRREIQSRGPGVLVSGSGSLGRPRPPGWCMSHTGPDPKNS